MPRRTLVYGDALPVDADVAAGSQVLEYFADHLSRSADAICNILLCELLADDQPAVLLDGELEQHARDAAVYVEQREAFYVLGQCTGPVDQLPTSRIENAG